jgi:hypothetical protein
VNFNLKSLNAGVPQGCGRATEAAKRPGERRHALAMTVAITRRPGKSWLDEDAERAGKFADGDRRADYRVGRGGDHRHVVGVAVHDIDLAAVRGHRQPGGEAADRDRADHVGRGGDHLLAASSRAVNRCRSGGHGRPIER